MKLKILLIFLFGIATSIYTKGNFQSNNCKKKIIVVYTDKNCFDCFNKLNSYIKTKYSIPNENYNLQYFFNDKEFIPQKMFLMKLKKVSKLNFVASSQSDISKYNSFYLSEEISPYLIIDSCDIVKIISYKKLFDNKGNIIKSNF